MGKIVVTDPEKQNTVIKPVDIVSRVHIPTLFFKRIGVNRGEDVIVTSTNDSVILTPKVPVCSICGSKNEIQKCADTFICKDCISEILKQKDE